MRPALADDLREHLVSHLARHPTQPVDLGTLREAAVGIVVLPGEAAEPSILLTRRSGRLRRHRGQWALPGGRVDAGESAEVAARRELREELGLALGAEAVLGSLDDYPTRSGYRIRPIVLWCPEGRELHPEPGEVAAVYRVPFADLERAVPASGRPRGPVPSLGLLGTRIFAPTAAIVVHFVEVALRGRSTRVDDFGEPVFAWS